MLKFCKDCIHYKICEYSTIVDKPTTCKDFLTADVAPVVHGEWIECGKDDNDMTIVQCSICQIKRYGAPAYCSRCGARMDGGNKND